MIGKKKQPDQPKQPKHRAKHRKDRVTAAFSHEVKIRYDDSTERRPDGRYIAKCDTCGERRFTNQDAATKYQRDHRG